MKTLSVLPLLVAFWSIAALPTGCSSDSGGDPQRLCTPGNYVYCRCADFSEGTKRCADDGQSFDECSCAPVDDTGAVEPDTFTPPDDTSVDTGVDTGPAKNDTCPGQTFAVDPTKELTFSGDTSSAGAEYSGATGACAVGTGPEHVYALIPTGTGSMTVKVTGKGSMDPTVYLRETDCATGTQLRCGETTGAAGVETFSQNVVTGRTYWLFVDGKAGSSGAYDVVVSLKTGGFCGDGKVESPEACDDGNKITGDGCGPDCNPQGDPTSGGTCPGVSVDLWPARTVTFTGTTNAYPDSYKASSPCAFGTASDRVYAITAHQSGTVKVKLDADFNAGLYARQAPCATGTQLACINAVTTSGPGIENLSFPVTDGKTYYLVVDGSSGAKGSFTLTIGW